MKERTLVRFYDKGYYSVKSCFQQNHFPAIQILIC